MKKKKKNKKPILAHSHIKSKDQPKWHIGVMSPTIKYKHSAVSFWVTNGSWILGSDGIWKNLCPSL